MKIRKYRLLRLEQTSSNFKTNPPNPRQAFKQFRKISEQWLTLLLSESSVYITAPPKHRIMEWFPSGLSGFILQDWIFSAHYR